MKIYKVFWLDDGDMHGNGADLRGLNLPYHYTYWRDYAKARRSILQAMLEDKLGNDPYRQRKWHDDYAETERMPWHTHESFKEYCIGMINSYVDCTEIELEDEKG